MKFIMAAILLISSPALAITTTQTKADTDSIVQSLEGKTESLRVRCDGDLCVIDYTLKAGESFPLIDKRAIRLALSAELSDLEVKLDDGTITNAELRRLIKIMLKLVRISRDQ